MEDRFRIAIVTGASSGLGREYALLADESREYDQIWAIARRAERLAELADRCETEVLPILLDLSALDAAPKLAAMLEDAAQAAGSCGLSLEVGLLVNAAGFGKFGMYDDMTLSEVDSMVDLNCRALVDITQVTLPYCHAGSRIIQIASSAAFLPLPGLNVYAATKAFVLSYTRALRFELRGRGINVTAVCPLWVKTEFIDVARDTANGQTVRHPFPVLDAKHVVRWSDMVNRANYPVATCCVAGAAMRVLRKLAPSSLAMAAWEVVRKI